MNDNLKDILSELVIDMAFFFETSDDVALDPDLAVEMLEFDLCLPIQSFIYNFFNQRYRHSCVIDGVKWHGKAPELSWINF